MPKITAEYLASQGLSETFPERFWSKVRKTKKCWIWTGCKCSFGYGNIACGRPSKKCIGAHLASWIIHRGPVPKGLCVLHNCPSEDNPSCVNPKHLWLGTKKDNTLDSVKKGAWSEKHPVRRGEQHSQHVLTENDVRQIRRLRKFKILNERDLAITFGVSFQHINDIVLRKCWTHIQ